MYTAPQDGICRQGTTRGPDMRKLFVLLMAMALSPAHAQERGYPSCTVQMMLPLAAGTSSDSAARLLAESLSEKLGRSVVVMNRPGAFGIIGGNALFQAKPDGCTIAYLAGAHATTTPAAFVAAGKEPPFDPTRLTPIGFTDTSYFVLVVRSDIPAQDAKEFLARAARGGFNVATGNPSGSLLTGVLKSHANVTEVRFHRGGEPDAHLSLLRGEVQGMFSTLFTALPHIQAGSIRALGVPGRLRSPFLPDVKTFGEQDIGGFDDIVTWGGLYGPPGLPPAIVRALSRALTATLAEPHIARRLALNGLSARVSTPDELGRVTDAQYRDHIRLIRRIRDSFGITVITD